MCDVRCGECALCLGVYVTYLKDSEGFDPNADQVLVDSKRGFVKSFVNGVMSAAVYFTVIPYLRFSGDVDAVDVKGLLTYLTIVHLYIYSWRPIDCGELDERMSKVDTGNLVRFHTPACTISKTRAVARHILRHGLGRSYLALAVRMTLNADFRLSRRKTIDQYFEDPRLADNYVNNVAEFACAYLAERRPDIAYAFNAFTAVSGLLGG